MVGGRDSYIFESFILTNEKVYILLVVDYNVSNKNNTSWYRNQINEGLVDSIINIKCNICVTIYNKTLSLYEDSMDKKMIDSSVALGQQIAELAQHHNRVWFGLDMVKIRPGSNYKKHCLFFFREKNYVRLYITAIDHSVRIWYEKRYWYLHSTTYKIINMLLDSRYKFGSQI